MDIHTSPFFLALRSKTGKTGFIMSAFSVLAVITLVLLEDLLKIEIPFLLLMLCGFGSVAGMQIFANEANRIRMEQERQTKDTP